MKIQTLLFENIYSPENLYHAWHKVSLGKSAKSSVLNFYRNLDKNLASIAEDLKNGNYLPGQYNLFLIRDPKERIISASPVRDRVVQHAMMNYYDPIFDRNFKERLHTRQYIRYMDDILVFSDDKEKLQNIYNKAVRYTAEKLKLVLKPQIIGHNTDGAPFLSFLVKSSGIYLQTKTKKRYKLRITEIEYKNKKGVFTDYEAGCRAESVTAHLLLARSRNFRNNVLHGRVLGD